MNAPAAFKPDEIQTFLGEIPSAEHELRCKLRSYRNAASALISRTRCDTARHLA